MHTPVPQLPKEIRFFEKNVTYMGAPNPDNDKAWDDLLPEGRGFIFVKNGAKYGLQPGVETKHGEIYSVAMYHQIHCLGLLRRNYWNLTDAIAKGNDTYMRDELDRQMHNSHTGHCFDYLRQSIECSADMTLEWPKVGKDGKRFEVDGEGIPHLCTSKQSLIEYMEVNHFNGSHRHDIEA